MHQYESEQSYILFFQLLSWPYKASNPFNIHMMHTTANILFKNLNKKHK